MIPYQESIYFDYYPETVEFIEKSNRIWKYYNLSYDAIHYICVSIYNFDNRDYFVNFIYENNLFGKPLDEIILLAKLTEET